MSMEEARPCRTISTSPAQHIDIDKSHTFFLGILFQINVIRFHFNLSMLMRKCTNTYIVSKYCVRRNFTTLFSFEWFGKDGLVEIPLHVHLFIPDD